jgi:hypothetical protein
MIFRPSRARRGDDPWLQQRTLIFLVGAALSIAGLVLDMGILINIAIVVLVIGAILGLVARRRADADTPLDDADDVD